MECGLGVVWFNNPVEQRRRWMEHVRRASERADQPLHVFQLDNSETTSPASEYMADGIRTTLLDPRGNVGFGRGHNALMAAAWNAGCTYYIGLNPDALLHRLALQHFFASVRHHPDDLVEMRQFPTEHAKHYDPLTGETEWVSGCAFGISHSLWSRIGGFDESMFMYCEDVDLSWRAREAGAKCFIAYRALVHHNIANRLPGVSHAVMLHSAYRLGVKWGLQDLCAAARTELRNLNAAPPPNDVDEADLVPRAPGIARFKDGFAFSATRWQI